jgi:hypothetical protein
MTTLNGWQRLWLLTSMLWAVVMLALAGMPDRAWTMQSALFVVRLWIVPVAAVYVFGLEAYRDCRRAHSLRGWTHGPTEQVFS